MNKLILEKKSFAKKIFQFICLITLFIISRIDSNYSQIIFSNPSFEGNPGPGIAPPSWSMCSGSPDVQPGFFGTVQTPSNGNSYLGFHHEESVSAFFANGIGLCNGLQFSMDVSIVPLDVPGNTYWASNNMGVNPGNLCIYGGYNPCDLQQLLWQSDLISNVLNWETIDIQLTATENFTYLNFTPCVNAPGSYTYFGIDNIQNVITAPLPVQVVGNQLVCVGQEINLNAIMEGATSYSWTGPNSFTSNLQNPIIPASGVSSSGTYTVIASSGSCDSPPSTIEITVELCDSAVTGIINEYSPVTGFNSCNNSIIVSDPTIFTSGSRALIIQMKGAVIDTSNTVSFGNIVDIANAGNYEFVDVVDVIGNNIQVANVLLNEYSVDGLVQLITVPQYSNINIIDNLTCLPWDGQIGGVLVFESNGVVSLDGVIDVTEKGFRPGTSSINAPFSCSQQNYFYPLGSTFGGTKGEGISLISDSFINGRGKNANGGGGGNDTNSGGAGGGNFGVGGRGGNQWTGCPNLSIGGEGGLSLQNPIGPLNRTFLGGGGGGGHQNDGVATPGTRGAGIVIIRADQLIGQGQIRANGLNALPSTGDGSGGGGSGGSVMLNIPNISADLVVNIEGGKGGSNNSHGPGGGGGGGVFWTVNSLGSNVSVNLLGGQPGLHSQTGTNHGAEAGELGGILLDLALNESNEPWTGNDTLTSTLIVSQCNDFLWAENGQTYSNSGQYFHSVTSQYGCDSTVILDLTIFPSEEITIYDSICQGEQFVFNGENYSSTGIFPIILSTVNGCDSLIVLNLTVNPLPPSPELSFQTASCPQDPITLSSDSVTGLSINWSGPNSFNSEIYSNTFVLTPELVGSYYAILIDQNCISIPSFIDLKLENQQNLDDYIFPNVLTPNGDNVNDSIDLSITNELCETFELVIFNRWGNIVFANYINSLPFTGLDLEGNELSQGVYFYQLKYFSGEKTGFIHLIR
jgi:gliding motility-associated-like protein